MPSPRTNQEAIVKKCKKMQETPKSSKKKGVTTPIAEIHQSGPLIREELPDNGVMSEVVIQTSTPESQFPTLSTPTEEKHPDRTELETYNLVEECIESQNESKKVCEETLEILHDLNERFKQFCDKQQADGNVKDMQLASMDLKIRRLSDTMTEKIDQVINSKVIDVYGCKFCRKQNHASHQCRTYPSGFERRQRLVDLGICVRCLEKSSHESCTKESVKCSFCGEIPGKNEVYHDISCCDRRYPYHDAKDQAIRIQTVTPRAEPSVTPTAKPHQAPKRDRHPHQGHQPRIIDQGANFRIPKKKPKNN